MFIYEPESCECIIMHVVSTFVPYAYWQSYQTRDCVTYSQIDKVHKIEDRIVFQIKTILCM